jgi:uncharacterized protein
MNVLFIHYELDPATLQPSVPFALDVRDGKAYVSVVAFSQQELRLAWGGALTAWAGAVVANHDFLNVRTYVRENRQPGIHFIAEWVPSRLAMWIAPRLYGLPYRLGRFEVGRVNDATGKFEYRVEEAVAKFGPCSTGSLDEFLLERYVAFTQYSGVRRWFRVAHASWPQTRVAVGVRDDGLLRANFPWWVAARFASANYSPGVQVTIARPERLPELGTLTRRWAYL